MTTKNGNADHSETVDDFLQEWKDANGYESPEKRKQARRDTMRRAMDILSLQDIMRLWDDIKRWLMDGK